MHRTHHSDRETYTKQENYNEMDSQQHPPFKRYKKDESADPTNPNPSLVIHVRNLSNKATEADLLEALSHFGHIAYATVMPNRHMALVEFETLDGARACVVYAQSNQIYVAGQPALFNYSTSQAIQRIGLESEIPNHILVLTVYNVQYPINVDIISQICKGHGDVRRIAIVRPKGILQALVEFDSVETARRAKYAMNGADIYSGCCTLKVEFAKVDRVKVTRNDAEQWDYTLPPGEQPVGYSNRKALLSNDQISPFGGQQGQGGGYGAGGGYGQSAQAMVPAPYNGIQGSGRGGSSEAFMTGYNPYDVYGSSGKGGGGSGGGGYGAVYQTGDYGKPSGQPEFLVCMIYGIDQDNFNCDKLFNILCCYGNPLKIKFMKSKQDTAMVEFGSVKECINACKYLTNMTCFGQTVTIRQSKAETLNEVHQPFNLPDGTPSYKDYRHDRRLRFSTPEQAQRNRLVYPTATLHWYNAPPSTDEEKLREVFEEKSAPIGPTVTVFKPKSEQARSATGICEFDSAEKATEAIMLVNHTPIEHAEGKPPYILKLAFYGSSGHDENPSRDRGHHQGGGGDRRRNNNNWRD